MVSISAILLGLVLAVSSGSASATAITIDSVSRQIRAGGGLDFQQRTSSSSSLGLFDDNFGISVNNEAEFFFVQAYQLSDVSLLGDMLKVDAATSAFAISGAKPGFESGGAFVISDLQLRFTVNDWVSYRASDNLLIDGTWRTPQDEVRLESTTTGQSRFSHNPSGPFRLQDDHSGLLAPGSYEYRFLSGGYLDPLPSGTREALSGSSFSLVITNVPEPSSLLLLVCGVCLLATFRWIRWTQQPDSTCK